VGVDPPSDEVEDLGVQPDEPTELDLQIRLQEVERSEAQDPLRWLLILLAVLTGLVLMPQSAAAGAAVFAGVAVAVTGVGFIQIRRGQKKNALQAELARHRRCLLEAAETPAERLAVLHEDLDRLRARPTGIRGLVLAVIATVLFVALGLSQGIEWVAFAGVFFGLMSAFGFVRLRERRRAERDLLEEIEED